MLLNRRCCAMPMPAKDVKPTRRRWHDGAKTLQLSAGMPPFHLQRDCRDIAATASR